MDIEQLLREGLAGNEDPGVRFTDSVLRQVSALASGQVSALDQARARRRSRMVLLGVLGAVAAAASMLGSQLLRSPDSQSAIAVEGASPVPVAIVAGALEAGSLPVAARPAAESTGVESASHPSASSTSEAVAATQRYTVTVMPVVHQSEDPAAKLPAEDLRASLIQALQLQPDVRLVGSGADYRLTITTLRERIMSSGDRGVVPADGAGVLFGFLDVVPGRVQWPVDVRIAEAVSVAGATPRDFRIMSALGADGDLLKRDCAGSGTLIRWAQASRLFESSLCASPETLAGGFASVLRPQPAIVEADHNALIARARTGSLNIGEQVIAVGDLAQAAQRGATDGNAASVSALLEFIAALPPGQRAQHLNRLRTMKHPDLVDPMIDMLRTSVEEGVRLEAVIVLSRNFSTEPRVRSAIEAASQSDPSPSVRMAARRVLSDGAEWSRYAITTLRDVRLAYAERVRPISYMSRFSSSPDQSAEFRVLMQDAGNVQTLVQLVREHLGEVAHRATTQEAMSVLQGSSLPAVIDLQLEIAADDRDAMQSLKIMAVAGLLKHRNDPRVRAELAHVARSTGDATLRNLIESQFALPEATPR